MLDLTKNSAPVSFSKAAKIRVRITWPAATDYDAGAEILYRDGSTESIATFGAFGVPARTVSKNGTVRHLGDVGRGGDMAEEIIEIDPDDEIAEIVPWAYSAQSNGTGSFRKYAVSMEVTAGNDVVRIAAANASDSATVYTCVPGRLYFQEDDRVDLEYAEYYSSPRSEDRPAFLKGGGFMNKHVRFNMDGPRNNYK